MKLLTIFLAFAALTTAQVVNTTRMYKLKTKLKGRPSGKEAFENLYLQGYHTGAGMSDVVLTTSGDAGIKGFLNATNITIPGTSSSKGPNYVSNQLFDFGNPFPWGLVMVPNAEFYSQWQPVEVNAGASGNEYTVCGFFMNDTGLQWTSNPVSIGGGSDSFGGWLVCDWWHGVLQLFFRISYYGTESTPGSCADVYLLPEYI